MNDTSACDVPYDGPYIPYDQTVYPPNHDNWWVQPVMPSTEQFTLTWNTESLVFIKADDDIVYDCSLVTMVTNPPSDYTFKGVFAPARYTFEVSSTHWVPMSARNAGLELNLHGDKFIGWIHSVEADCNEDTGTPIFIYTMYMNEELSSS